MNQSNGGELSGGLTDDSPIDERDERLVAYLDGELDPEDRKALEIQLGRDAELRARLRSLQDGWELLDALPMATPSAVLLESTLRMAATEATWNSKSQTIGKRGRLNSLTRWVTPTVMWVLLLSAIGFVGGAVAVRVNSSIRFHNQLRHLPIAMHVDAYLHGADLELMRSLMQDPQWQQAVAIAGQLGEWDFTLQRTISQATPQQRQEILPELSIEDQQQVTEAWQQFEQLGDSQRQAVVSVASRVAEQSDAEQLLTTMNRYAQWQQSLAPPQRDAIANADFQQRKAAIAEAIGRTTRQWKQQTARMLSDEDFDTIYQALRQIARLRIDWLELDQMPVSEQTRRTLVTFGMQDQAMSPRMESYFLRWLFESRDAGSSRGEFGPRGREPGPPGGEWGAARGAPGPRGEPAGNDVRSRQAPPPPPPEFSLMSSGFAELLPLLSSLQGPLDNEELWMIESVLSPEISKFLAAAASIEDLRTDLLRSWVEDAIRRMSSYRSGTTLSERYKLLDSSKRDQLDLLPPDRILESLRDDGRRRRFTP